MSKIEKIQPSHIFTNYIYKAIPLAFDESMSYYETLCGILDILKTHTEVINNNAEVVAELENYVEHYFDSLDVQQEINDKLDEMAQDGTLGNLLNQYSIPYTKDSYILAVFHDYISANYYNPYSGGVGDGRTPRFLLSKDGVNFNEFNKSIYPLMINAPSTENGWCGAPSIVFYDNKFFMVSSGGIKTSTNDGAIGVSEDLIHWTWYDYTLGVRYPGAQVIIPAPELCVLNNELYLIESIYTGENENNYKGISVTVSEPYIAKVESFDEENGFTFTGVRKLIFYDENDANLSNNKSHIDTTIIYKDGFYYALSKNEISVAIESFRSTDLTNWQILNRDCFWRYTEAPTVCYYGGTFHVYADASQLESGSQNEMYHAVTDDFITFKYFAEVKAPRKYTTRHGSVFTITADNTLANKIIRAIPDVAIGDGNGEDRKPVYLGLSTTDIQFEVQEGNTRQTSYMSICPNTIYYINANHDYVIDNLDNHADVGEVLIYFTPNVTNATLTITKSGVDGNFVEINDTYVFDNSKNSNYIKLIKNNGILRIANNNAITYDLLDKFSSWGTFTSTSWVKASKLNDVVSLSVRLLNMNANTTKTLSSSALPSEIRPTKNKIINGYIRTSGNYVGSTWISCIIAFNASGSIQVFTNDDIPAGSVLEFCMTFRTDI